MQTGNRNRFPASVRIRKRREFQSVRQDGEFRQGRHFVVYLRSGENGPTRLGITVSRRVGNAVTRNRVKRLVREFFRTRYRQLPAHTDISVIARNSAARLDSVSAERDLLVLLQMSQGTGCR